MTMKICAHEGCGEPGTGIFIVDNMGATLGWCGLACFQADYPDWLKSQDPWERCRCTLWRTGKICCVHRHRRLAKGERAIVAA
jgi:hypothetical protein